MLSRLISNSICEPSVLASLLCCFVPETAAAAAHRQQQRKQQRQSSSFANNKWRRAFSCALLQLRQDHNRNCLSISHTNSERNRHRLGLAGHSQSSAFAMCKFNMLQLATQNKQLHCSVSRAMANEARPDDDDYSPKRACGAARLGWLPKSTAR